MSADVTFLGEDNGTYVITPLQVETRKAALSLRTAGTAEPLCPPLELIGEKTADGRFKIRGILM